MERTFSPEERIRRAEEIYVKRKNLRERTRRASINVTEEPKNFKLLKKLALQIIICVIIYYIFYLVNTTSYSFSQEALTKADELISHDFDFYSVYNNVVKSIQNYLYQEKDSEENQNVEGQSEEPKNEVPAETEEAPEQTSQEEINEEESLTQNEISVAEESETERIKNKFEFIKPAEGPISSEYGTREVTSSVVTAYHKGIDIAVNTGTPVYASTDGEVVISRLSPTYGNYVMIQNEEIKTVYAHCSELLVGVRR